MISVAQSAESRLVRLIEIAATEATREEWESKFWALFPSAIDEFEQMARGTHGIRVGVRLPGSSRSRLKSQYGPYSTSKLRRISQAGRPPGTSTPPALRDALIAFERDQQLEHQEQERLAGLVRERLPQPPTGYYWAPDAGGTRLPDAATFRLWSRRFGYMPHSE